MVGRAAQGKAGSIEDGEGMSMAEGVKKVKNDGDSTNWVLYRFDKQKKKIWFFFFSFPFPSFFFFSYSLFSHSPFPPLFPPPLPTALMAVEAEDMENL